MHKNNSHQMCILENLLKNYPHEHLIIRMFGKYLSLRSRLVPGNGIEVIPLVFRPVVVTVAGLEGGTLVIETSLGLVAAAISRLFSENVHSSDQETY